MLDLKIIVSPTLWKEEVEMMPEIISVAQYNIHDNNQVQL